MAGIHKRLDWIEGRIEAVRQLSSEPFAYGQEEINQAGDELERWYEIHFPDMLTRDRARLLRARLQVFSKE